MSETEALMWAVEQDPRLISTMGSVLLLDGAPDPARLRAAVTLAVASVPRLRQRVVEQPTALAPPVWRSDTSFDLDHHLRHVRVPAPGTDAELRRLASHFISDPFDRTRPLWQLLVVTGLRGGRSALVAKLHHAVTDGTGALLIAQHLVELSDDAPPPDPVDLREVLEADRLSEADDTASSSGEQLRRGTARVLRMVGDAATALADPYGLQSLGNQAVASARAVAAQLPGGERRTSPLWAARSRNRRLEWLALPLPPALDRARRLGGTLNDLFVTATLEGAVRYHEHQGVEPEDLTATIVVSTRSAGDHRVGNAFAPASAILPASRSVDPEERFRRVSSVLAVQKQAVRDARDALGPITGLASLLPPAVATGLALDQAGRVDFATSNLRGIPVPIWVAGRRVQALYPVGPVGGTAFNVTLMSNLDELHVGLHIDPTAVTDPGLLARCVEEGFGRFGVTARGRAPRRSGAAR